MKEREGGRVRGEWEGEMIVRGSMIFKGVVVWEVNSHWSIQHESTLHPWVVYIAPSDIIVVEITTYQSQFDPLVMVVR